MQFALENQQALVASVNPRMEKHGEDGVLACDVKVELNAAHSILDAFDGDLLKLLFRKASVGEQQSLLQGRDALTGLKFPLLQPLRWDQEFTGYSLSIANGMGLSEPLVCEGVELKKFQIEPLEGGTVKLTFNVVCHPDAEQMGQLCELIQEQVELTLEAPAAAGAKKAA